MKMAMKIKNAYLKVTFVFGVPKLELETLFHNQMLQITFNTTLTSVRPNAVGGPPSRQSEKGPLVTYSQV